MNPLFDFWVILLILLLFFPVSNLIWVTSVRRLQRKLDQPLEATALRGQKKLARFIALLLVVPFAWFFNLYLMGITLG